MDESTIAVYVPASETEKIPEILALFDMRIEDVGFVGRVGPQGWWTIFPGVSWIVPAYKHPDNVALADNQAMVEEDGVYHLVWMTE
jgi:hypothetical protein|nr:MAG TPA: hypothetical protein [Caudoviricetes sp.]